MWSGPEEGGYLRRIDCFITQLKKKKKAVTCMTSPPPVNSK
jgi:hypothetical protein